MSSRTWLECFIPRDLTTLSAISFPAWLIQTLCNPPGGDRPGCFDDSRKRVNDREAGLMLANDTLDFHQTGMCYSLGNFATLEEAVTFLESTKRQSSEK